jgi:hypothetical protein
MFNLVDSYCVLLIDRHSIQAGSIPQKYARGLAQSVLMELIASERFTIDRDGNIFLASNAPLDSPACDRVLQEMDHQKMLLSVQEWIDRLEQLAPYLFQLVIKDLTKRGIVRIEDRRHFYLFKTPVYTLTRPYDAYWTQLRLRSVALFCEPPTPEETLLLQILTGEDLLPWIFERDELSVARRTIPAAPWNQLSAHPARS